jgi:glutamate-5-semialdehyde dehydrogenase
LHTSNVQTVHQMHELKDKGIRAKAAGYVLAAASEKAKNDVLNAAADSLRKEAASIITANRKDLAAAKAKGLSGAIIDRLTLNKQRIEDMAIGLEQITRLEDPVGEVLEMKRRPNGLLVGRKRVPLGVIGVIYESRPNVTVDVFGLCLKTGNVAILRGGSEAFESNRALTAIIRSELKKSELPEDSLQLIEDTSRETAVELMKLDEYLDILIPRGGAGLIKTVVQNSTVPVIETGVGNCHIYVDRDADLDKAAVITVNAKTQRPGVCNAAESLLVHEGVAREFIPRVCMELEEHNVEIRGDELVRDLVPNAIAATEEDWYAEFLDLIISVKVVASAEEAIDHIRRYGSGHSECIVTENYSTAGMFLDRVDSAAVYVNASTRFTDGFEFGFGAEIGISTQKLHARGPMGLKELTTTKFIIYGQGQIRT